MHVVFLGFSIFMEETGEKGWVPFLEKKYQSVDRFTRVNILLAYIGLVRADSVGFVEKAITEEDVETRAYRSIYRKIAGQMKTANNEGREKILGFFLRRIETVSDDSERNLLDQILEAGLPEYRASTQRKRYADRFMKSEHEFARQRGKDILQEIEKVPTSQRKDLSELLRKPADERKSE